MVSERGARGRPPPALPAGDPKGRRKDPGAPRASPRALLPWAAAGGTLEPVSLRSGRPLTCPAPPACAPRPPLRPPGVGARGRASARGSGHGARAPALRSPPAGKVSRGPGLGGSGKGDPFPGISAHSLVSPDRPYPARTGPRIPRALPLERRPPRLQAPEARAGLDQAL